VVITFLLIEKVGRRTLTVPTQWLCAVVLAIIGLWTGAPAPIVLILFLVFSFFNAGYNTLTNVYPGEVLPTEIRGIGTGFAAAISRVGAGLGIFLFPMSMESLGSGPTMLIASGVALLGAGLSQWLAPETKGEDPDRGGSRLRTLRPPAAGPIKAHGSCSGRRSKFHSSGTGAFTPTRRLRPAAGGD
jgi:putative MFS transporter